MLCRVDRGWGVGGQAKSDYVRTARFFRALTKEGIRHLVFSSTAAVYGSATNATGLTESHRLQPANPYGLTKLACELTLQGAGACHNLMPGVRFEHPPTGWPPLIAATGPAEFAPPSSLIFRYFNAAGAHPAVGLGEVHDPESHLIPRAIFSAIKAARTRDGTVLTINGDDYPTEDGTCVRDYVHVLDLAEAGPRRAGDSARLVADVAKARVTLGWQPRRGLHEIIASAAEFHRRCEVTGRDMGDGSCRTHG